jgi:hypothetical protein
VTGKRFIVLCFPSLQCASAIQIVRPFRVCNMNGKNSLEELDRHPIELCPYCVEKLQSVNGFDFLNRVNALIECLSVANVDISEDYFYAERGCLTNGT